MTAPDLAGFLALVSGRRGHFRLESGHHGALWLDLDTLFTHSRLVDPFVSALTEGLGAIRAEVICGPMIGGAFLAQLVAARLGARFCFTRREAPVAPSTLYGVHYSLPAALQQVVRGRRVAIVDDVMSAGSALLGTRAALETAGAQVVVAGALLVLGHTGERALASLGVPTLAAVRDDYELWEEPSCPQCKVGVPLQDLSANG